MKRQQGTPPEYLDVPCQSCGHNGASHYNLRPRPLATNRQPCHHVGRHDSRCYCPAYVPPVEQA